MLIISCGLRMCYNAVHPTAAEAPLTTAVNLKTMLELFGISITPRLEVSGGYQAFRGYNHPEAFQQRMIADVQLQDSLSRSRTPCVLAAGFQTVFRQLATAFKLRKAAAEKIQATWRFKVANIHPKAYSWVRANPRSAPFFLSHVFAFAMLRAIQMLPAASAVASSNLEHVDIRAYMKLLTEHHGAWFIINHRPIVHSLIRNGHRCEVPAHVLAMEERKRKRSAAIKLQVRRECARIWRGCANAELLCVWCPQASFRGHRQRKALKLHAPTKVSCPALHCVFVDVRPNT